MSLQILINGIATGSIYALIATGFALIFNILKFSNFSHGATMTSCAFIAYFLSASKGWGLVPTLLIAAAAGALSWRSASSWLRCFCTSSSTAAIKAWAVALACERRCCSTVQSCSRLLALP